MKISHILLIKVIILSAVFLFSIPFFLNAEQSQERLDKRLNEGMNSQNSIDQQKMSSTTPADGFKYFSGNTCPINNHPAIYAGNENLYVVGYEFYKEFPISETPKAFEAYMELLKLDGYLNND